MKKSIPDGNMGIEINAPHFGQQNKIVIDRKEKTGC